MSSRLSRAAWSGACAVLLLTIPSAASIGADSPSEDPTLCDALVGEAVEQLSPMRWGEPLVASAVMCMLNQSPEQQGPHSFLVSKANGLTLEDFKATNPAGVEVAVGDDPGIVDGRALYVGTADGILIVEADIEASAEGAGVDAIEYAMAMAQLVANDLKERQGAPEPVIVTALAPPPDVPGVTWSGVRERVGEEITGRSSPAEVARWQTLVDATGGRYEQLQTLDADASSTDGAEQIGNYGAIRVPGADEAALKPAILEWFRSAFGVDELPVEQSTIGGKDVTVITFAPEQIVYVYVKADTVYGLILPEDVLAAALEALP